MKAKLHQPFQSNDQEIPLEPSNRANNLRVYILLHVVSSIWNSFLHYLVEQGDRFPFTPSTKRQIGSFTLWAGWRRQNVQKWVIRAKLLFCQSKPIAFLPFSLPSSRRRRRRRSRRVKLPVSRLRLQVIITAPNTVITFSWEVWFTARTSLMALIIAEALKHRMGQFNA